MTGTEKAAILTKVIGRSVELAQPQLPAGFKPDEEQQAVIHFSNFNSPSADIAAIRKTSAGRQTFESYLHADGW
jgi:hypothetical protein